MNDLNLKIAKVYRFSLILSIMIFINIFFGPLVRATDSGLACPDWPLCFGKVIPPPEFRIWMEVGHRFYSGLLGLGILGLFIYIIMNIELRKIFLFQISLVVFLTSLQVILGRLTVTMGLDPRTVNSHLLTAILLWSVTFSITLKTKGIKESSTKYIDLNNFKDPLSVMILITCLSVFFQIFLGGRVSSNYAGLACPEWPTCVQGIWFPGFEGQIGYHLIHRLVGYFVFILILINFVLAKKSNLERKSFLFVKTSLHVVALQIILGIFNVIFRLPVLLTAFHTLVGATLFLVLFAALYQKLSLIPDEKISRT